MTGLSEAELAARAGVDPERIRRMAELGIIERSEGEDGPYRLGDIQRVRVVEAFEETGISLADLGRAIAAGKLSFSFLDMVFPEPSPMSGKTYRELCEEAGLPMELVERLQIGFGLPRPLPDEQIRQEDAEIYPLLPTILSAGLGEGQVIRGVRVYGENLRRVAEYQVDLAHSYLEEPIRRSGVSESELLEMAARTSSQVRPVADKLVMWLYRRHREHYTVKHFLEHAESMMEQAGLISRDPKKEVAIAFLDMTGYTRLTEEEGDEVAAELAANLAVLVQESASQHRGRPIKWLGDGVMFHFEDPGDAVLCGLELVEEAPEAGLPRAHVGVNAGPVIFRDSDYFGRTVNVASRIAAFARPGEVLVSDSVVAASKPDGVTYADIGPIVLQGLVNPVNLHVAIRARVSEDSASR